MIDDLTGRKIVKTKRLYVSVPPANIKAYNNTMNHTSKCQLAKMLKVSRTSVTNWIIKKLIIPPDITLGGRQYYSDEAINQILQEVKVKGEFK